MLILALLAIMTDVVATERAAFEKFWTEKGSAPNQAGISKKTAWHVWVWTQGQFSLGFCSEFIPADAAKEMRRVPDEATLMKSELGRQFLLLGSSMFRDGMDFRREVKPTVALCETELSGRAEVMRASAPD